jgi:uridine kinase
MSIGIDLFIFTSIRILVLIVAGMSSFLELPAQIELLTLALTVDFIIYFILTKTVEKRTRNTLWTFNPLAAAGILLLDNSELLRMILLLTFAYLVVSSQNYAIAGINVGFLIFLYPLYFIILPIILVYGLGSPRYRKKLILMNATSVATLILLILTMTFLDGGSLKSRIQILLDSDLILKMGNLSISATLLIYILSIFWLYRTPRTTQNVFVIFSIITVCFSEYFQQNSSSTIFILIPAVMLAVNLGSNRFILVMLALELLSFSNQINTNNVRVEVVLTTLLFTYFTFFALRVIRHGIFAGDKYKFAAAPLSIAIAGDSGVGKDTFAQSIATPFGSEFTNIICGDDYHRFERLDEAWLNTTHLNPRMNNLPIWQNHLQNAMKRIPYKYKSYDHNSGKFQQGSISESGDLVISQGLHALYPELVKQMDLTVYLKMEDSLRVGLKVRRDSSLRSQSTQEIEKKILERKSDFQEFVSIQENYADYTIKQVDAENHGQSPTGIEIHSERHLDVIRLLAQNYIDICGDNSIKFENLYSGNIVIDTRNFKAEHVASILRKELVDFKQLFPNVPKFSDGNEGIFQALVFLHLDSQRRESDFLNYEA